MLRVEGLHVAYGDVEVVAGVDLEVADGEIVALIGANGAGKSTVLQAVCGLHPASGGDVSLDGRSICGEPVHRTSRLGIAFVPAQRHLFADMTVDENLAMGAYPRREDRATRDEVLALFPRLRARRAQRAGTMSGGEQQTLAIGRALMARPRLLLLDEPSTGLAPLVADEVYGALQELRNRGGLTILLAEQQVPLAFRLADRAYVLDHGRVQVSGPVASLRDDPAIRHAYLGMG